jgi:uncharacterized OsmC-like protein
VKIILLTDESLRIVPSAGMLTVEAPTADQSYSPFHMMASGWAMCTWSILQSWASTVKIPVDDLVVDVTWRFADEPHRVSEMSLVFDWPSLPPARRETARRVAALCPIHKTFEQPPTVSIAAAA